MELVFSKNDLWEAMRLLDDIASGRDLMPILANVLITADNDTIQLTATNLELGMRCLVPGEIISPGAITVPAKKFAEIVHELSTKIRIKGVANDRVEVISDAIKYRVSTLPCDEFPAIPDIGDHFVTLNANMLCDMISKTIFAAASDKLRHYLNGVYLATSGDTIKIVATDGRKLALTIEKIDTMTDMSVLVPTNAANNVIKIFKNSDTINVSINNEHIVFANDAIMFTSRLVEGDYPDYEKIIDPVLKNAIIVNIETAQLLSAIKRVSLLANPKAPSVVFIADSGKVILSANMPELGEAREELSAQTDGGKIEIAFNPNFMLAALRSVMTETVTLKFRDATSPILVMPADADNYLCVIMPMRL